MANIEKGILADGLGCLTAGVLGGMGQSTSSSNVGLSLATGATSRMIAFFTGGVLILLAFLPKFAAVFTVMPRPIVGATLIFALSFMIVAGFQIIMTRMLDGRKIFIIGISTIFGLSVDMLPGVYADMHPWLQPVFSSSLAAGAVCAVVLNLVFRIGISQKASLELTAGVDTSRAIYSFLDERGRAWGARMEVVNRAVAALTELYDTLCLRQLAQGRVSLAVRFDEYNLDVDIAYPGEAMEFSTQAPRCEDILEDPAAQAALSGFLIGNFVDRIDAAQKEGIQQIRFHFDH